MSEFLRQDFFLDSTMLRRGYFSGWERLGFVSLSRRVDLIGLSHPKASSFLLLRQKKGTKEKAARMPLIPCAPRF
jgi:hypothetical protein